MQKKSILSLLAFAAMTVVGCSKNYEKKIYNEGINVIPVPAQLTLTDSLRFTLTANTVISVSSPDFKPVAEFFVSAVQPSTGYALTLKDTPSDANYISFELDTRVAVNNEGYTLSSNQNGITIKARTPQGAFYGAQTLLQLLPAEIVSKEIVKTIQWSVPSVEVKDEPRFKYRGFMMDVCRHFRTVDFIKKQLDVMAMLKMNVLHWHLTDDQAWRVEIKKYPKLTEMGSVRTEGDGQVYGPYFYTQEQIKEVVAYAAKLNIEVIPEIEMPGHAMAALVGYPELSCTGGPFKQPRIVWGVEDEVFCAGNEQVYTFLQDVIDEVAPLFPSEYFHVGGDECPKIRWEKCPKCQAKIKAEGFVAKDGHSPEERLQSYLINRMEKYLNGKGKKLIGWDEILEGGLTPSAIVMSWRGQAGGIAAANVGNNVIMTPNSEGMYIDHFQGAAEVEPVSIGGYSTVEKVYAFDPIPADLPEDKHHFIMGGQANLWAEYIIEDQHYEYMMYPRLLALAEADWSPVSRKDWTDFQKRLDNTLVRLDLMGVNYHIPMPEGVLTQNIVYNQGDTVRVNFKNTRNLPMVYTVDGTEPNAKSQLVNGEVVLQGEGVVKVATLLPASGKLSKVRSIAFGKQEMKDAVVVESAKQGAKLKVADGLYTNAADYANARFSKDTVVSALFESKLWDYNKPSLAVFEGYVELPQDGVYTFTTDMDQLYLDGELLIENPKMSRHYRNKFQKAMKAGKHSYKMVFNNMVKDGWPNNWSLIGFQFKPNGGEWTKAEGEIITY